MRVGVTGAAGFIGSHVCERLLAEGYDVVGLDDMSYGSVQNLEAFAAHPKFWFEVADCTDRQALRQVFAGCGAILHLAAKKIPRYESALSTLEVNVAGSHAACDVALELDADLVIASTSDVYGTAEPPFAEDGPVTLGPSTTRRWGYAVSKLYDEHLALALAEEKGLRVTILRLFNAYGPRNHLSWWGGPVVTFPEALLNGEAMEIHGDGAQTRCFTYVTDTADGFLRALRTPASRGHIVNVGREESISILGLAEKVQTMLDLPLPLRATFVPYEALPGNYQDVRDRVPNTTKARELLGFEASVSIEEGLKATIEWHRSLRRPARRRPAVWPKAVSAPAAAAL